MSDPADRQAAFVKVTLDAPDHWKVVALSRRLGIDENQAFGAVVRLWAYLPEHTSGGRLGEMEPQHLAAVMKLYDVDPTELLETLVEFRLLDREEGGHLVVHDWTEDSHTGAFLQQRSIAGALGNHERWHVQRGIAEPDCPHCAASHMRSQIGIADLDQDSDRDKDKDKEQQQRLSSEELAMGKNQEQAEGKSPPSTPSLDWWRQNHPGAVAEVFAEANKRKTIRSPSAWAFKVLTEDYLPRLVTVCCQCRLNEHDAHSAGCPVGLGMVDECWDSELKRLSGKGDTDVRTGSRPMHTRG